MIHNNYKYVFNNTLKDIENNNIKSLYDFYDILISVGICQTDPIKAAQFINRISDNPSEWWESEIVKNARFKFLDTNIGSSVKMMNYLLDLSK